MAAEHPAASSAPTGLATSSKSMCSVVYFVLALWLFRGRNSGYGRVMVKLVDALYHRRRGQELLDGVLDPDGWVQAGQGRRWRPPNISSLARVRLGSDPRSLPRTERGPLGLFLEFRTPDRQDLSPHVEAGTDLEQ